jgi:general secretion pathway protein K
MARANERGFVLVAALWLVAALAVLAGAYARYADNVAVSARLHADDFQIEAAERSAIEMAVQRLNGTPKTRPVRALRGKFAFPIGSAEVEVAFVSEAARIDLNNAPASMLAKLFANLGVSDEDARAYALSVVAWGKSAENDNEADAYRAAGLSYAPRNAPFQDALELSLVRGLPPSVVARALPFVTVFGGPFGIDPRIAAPEVLAALPGLDPDLLPRLMKAQQDPSVDDNALLGMLGGARAYVTTEPQAGCRVDVTVRLKDGRSGRAQIVIAPTPSEGEPYRVLAWSDD